MYKKVFCDANVLIDICDLKRPNYEESYKLVSYLLQNDIKIYTSCDLITTIYYILSKDNKEKALFSIEDINSFCHIIEFSNKEVSQTCELMKKNSKFKDLEDSIQYILAKKQKCDLIISNDKNFASEDIKVLTSKEFLELYL